MKGHILVGSSPLPKVPEVLWEINGKRILDIGCGAGIYGYIIRNRWQDTYIGRNQMSKLSSRDPKNDKPEFLGGVDIRVNDVLRCKYHNVYDYICLANASNLPFPENFVDVILCIEVLEHLTKEEALKAIENFKKIASKQVIITVPKNAIDRLTQKDERQFLKFKSDDPEVIEFIEAEKHKSIFTQKELKDLGFQIGETIYDKGLIGFLKKIRRIYRNKLGRNKIQIMAVCSLNKSNNNNNSLPVSNKFTDNIPDFR